MLTEDVMQEQRMLKESMFKVRDLAEIPISITSFDGAVAGVCSRALQGKQGMDIHLINAYSIALTSSDQDYWTCLKNATCNLPDGKPLSVLTRFSESALSQVRGPSFFEALLDQGRVSGLRHFLLGSTPETLEALEREIERKYPGAEVVGSESPPFRKLSQEELSEQDARIRQAGPHIVWVGLGTPKQDFEAQRLASAGFNAVAVGAAFDFTAGMKREAPKWMTATGLEWVFRFATEPRRLWRRYLIGNVQFLLALAKKR